MRTRDRILNTARTLFNERGTAAVSTNHIAAALGISPGNLYYHFRNKEEIIAALFEKLFATWGERSLLPADRLPVLADFDAALAATYQLIWEYRFAYREMAVLLQKDPKIHAGYLEMRRRGYEGFAALVDTLVHAGVLTRPETEQELIALTELCWIISEQWPINLELSGRAFDADGIQEGVALMRYLFRPYLVSSQ
ncbi:TetR/AcrR family transcriptional regulator [Chloroflexi bacterium TSY]|nr:TetR/AcrR family transcriptional regulator [Chloroflexi bacterium TSY]